MGRFCLMLVSTLRQNTRAVPALATAAEWEVDVEGLQTMNYGVVERFSTVALVPISQDVPLESVACLLTMALQMEGSTLRLNSSVVCPPSL